MGGPGQWRSRVGVRERQRDNMEEMQVERSEEKGKKGPSRGGEMGARGAMTS